MTDDVDKALAELLAALAAASPRLDGLSPFHFALLTYMNRLPHPKPTTAQAFKAGWEAAMLALASLPDPPPTGDPESPSGSSQR